MIPHKYRLKKRRDFRNVYKYGFSGAGKYLVIYALKNKNNVSFFRFGCSVSRKIGNAVVRNRVKRLIREACRNNLEYFNNGFDIIVIAKRNIKAATYREIEKDLLKLVKKLNLSVVDKG